MMNVKKNILTRLGLTAFFSVIIVSLIVVSGSGTTSAYAFTAGAPSGGSTGSPTDMNTCNTSGCHTGSAINSGTASVRTITSTIPVSGYISGVTYTITGNITEATINKFGFEITAERDADNSKVGTVIITNATNTKNLGTTSITHRAAGTSGAGSKSWSFDWTAPAVGTGDVTFYGAFNAANNNGSSSGDNIYTASLSVTEDITTVGLAENFNGGIINIFPNPFQTSFQISTTKTIDRVEIYNLEGKKMTNLVRTLNKVNMENFPSGVYFVKIESRGNVATKKIIKNSQF